MDPSLFSTPSLDHISPEDYLNIYEPDQDSFLFLDALENEYSFLKQLDPTIIVEIGPGSGIISTFLTRIVNESHPTATLAIDINMDACRITRDTYHQNKNRLFTVIQSVPICFNAPFRDFK
ncbi:uncharacterized protein [Blastocystis hominis]|uniref:Methyltransferase small domain-containing protein n=1 Tax=Blastocystis hominis TaxID=12968 RepID=D8LWG5_BLAHO|nr:uncharacterized protein [Blastocystis hominis]CBK20154.2 unnamed protein product [Blastocystis hominis]|eukprot:XP_012894202.1 uncharacterized protein [Blastocystis hominis]